MFSPTVLRTGPYAKRALNDVLPPFPADVDGQFRARNLTESWGFSLTREAGAPRRPLLPADPTPSHALMTRAYQEDRCVGYITYSWERPPHLVCIHQLRAVPTTTAKVGLLLLEQAQRYARELAARGTYMKPFTRHTGVIDLLAKSGYQLWSIEQGMDPERSSVQMGRPNPEAIPTVRLCHQLLTAYGLAAGIIHHSILTETVASLLAESLQTAGVTLDTRAVSAGALLHDIGKARDPAHHHTASRQIVEQEGYPLLGSIVERHLTTLILTSEAPVTWEEKLVCYADKVCTYQVVSLSERFRDLCQRYQEKARPIRRALAPFLRLEEEIYSYLAWPPHQLAQKLREGLAQVPARSNLGPTK